MMACLDYIDTAPLWHVAVWALVIGGAVTLVARSMRRALRARYHAGYVRGRTDGRRA